MSASKFFIVCFDLIYHSTSISASQLFCYYPSIAKEGPAYPSALIPTTLHFTFTFFTFIEVLLQLVVFLYLEPQFTLYKFLFLLIPFSNTPGHTYFLCAAFCIDAGIKFCLLAIYCPKSLSALSAPTECQTVNRFGHITNSVSVEKAIKLTRCCWFEGYTKVYKVVNSFTGSRG